MKTRAVRKYPAPGYPTKPQALADPELLAKNLPKAWRGRPEMAGAICAFLALNACQNGVPADPGNSSSAEPEGLTQGAVAPIFIHGEGRGATGCVVVAPPVFLSEEDALQVIAEEMKLRNLELDQQDVAVEGVSFLKRDEQATFEDDVFVVAEVIDPEAPPIDYTMDRSTADGRIGIEFVSRADYFDFGGPDSTSSVQGYDLRMVSARLSTRMDALGKDFNFGVFYDPMEHGGSYRDSGYDESQLQAKKRSKELLRLQVKDFLDWLEAQGAL
jgi:hypothetical protein